MFPDEFIYERKTNPPKDVDCSFESDGFRFNIEIKCPDYSKMHEIDQKDAFKVSAFGRMDDYRARVEMLQRNVFSGEVNLSAELNKPLICQLQMDNKLKDFLLLAHEKFAGECSEQELNVLIVCCSDRMSMQQWFFYMFGAKGLLTGDSYHPPEQYSNVDTVILTNVYHRHHQYKSKNKIADHWNWAKSFNLIFSNPLRKKEKEGAIWKLLNLIPNFSLEVKNFQVEIEELRIVHFIIEELLAKELYYFQPDN